MSRYWASSTSVDGNSARPVLRVLREHSRVKILGSHFSRCILVGNGPVWSSLSRFAQNSDSFGAHQLAPSGLGFPVSVWQYSGSPTFILLGLLSKPSEPSKAPSSDVVQRLAHTGGPSWKNDPRVLAKIILPSCHLLWTNSRFKVNRNGAIASTVSAPSFRRGSRPSSASWKPSGPT